MSEKMKRLILPYAVPAEDRVKVFGKDMEMAAIFYFAESDREKGKGRILKRLDERLVFITEACYPIWLVPWRGRTLLFDGLAVSVHTLSYDLLPDVSVFNNDIRVSAKTPEAYSVALFQNTSYFQNFAGREEKTVEGLITDPEFIQDFFAYLSEVNEVETHLTTKAVLSPTIHKSEVFASIGELSDLRDRLKEDIKNLSKGMKLLSIRNREHVKTIREEIKETRKKFDKKIGKVEPRVKDRIRRIQERHDDEITRISKRFERQLRILHKDHVKLERTHKRLTAEIDRCEAEIKSCRLRKDEGGEIQWSQKLEKIRKRLPTLEKGVRDVDAKIVEVETAKKLEISQRRTSRDDSIEEAMKTLRELEASREASIIMKRQETTSLKDVTSSIIDQMNNMVKSKKGALGELDRLGTPGRREHALVYLPLYFVCYETESRKRYVVYPPSVVGSMGILTKLKGVFGVTKMKSFLEPRSKAIAALINQLVILAEEDPVFEKEISDAGIKANILRTTEVRLGVKRGLKELMEEKWISESEFQTFSKLL